MSRKYVVRLRYYFALCGGALDSMNRVCDSSAQRNLGARANAVSLVREGLCDWCREHLFGTSGELDSGQEHDAGASRLGVADLGETKSYHLAAGAVDETIGGGNVAQHFDLRTDFQVYIGRCLGALHDTAERRGDEGMQRSFVPVESAYVGFADVPAMTEEVGRVLLVTVLLPAVTTVQGRNISSSQFLLAHVFDNTFQNWVIVTEDCAEFNARSEP